MLPSGKISQRSALATSYHISHIYHMAMINIKNVPDDVRDEFKALCASNGTNMSEEIVRYMKSAVFNGAVGERAEIAERNRSAIRLIGQWLEDSSGYDQRTWPKVRRSLEENRLASRKLFGD